MTTKKRVEVCFTPNAFDLYKEEHQIAVVIDTLRATSAICAGLHYGVKKIIPVSTLEEALEYQEKGFIVAAERKGQIVKGFDMGNSPYGFMKPELKGKTVVLTTTNGTKTINIAKGIETVVIGSLLNLKYLCDWLLKQDKNVLVIGSGWENKFNLEDTITAGAIADFLLSTNKFTSTHDSSIAAKYLYQSASTNYFGFLKSSSHRRRLKKLNLNEDIKYCLTPNTCPVIPILKNGELVKM